MNQAPVRELLGAPGGTLEVRLGALGVDFGDFWLSEEAPGARSELFRKSSSRVYGSMDFEIAKAPKRCQNRSKTALCAQKCIQKAPRDHSGILRRSKMDS